MNFVSEQFLAFLIVVWSLFLLVPARYRMLLLLAASYVFYGTWSIPFIGVILLTTSIDYFASKSFSSNLSPKLRKVVFISALMTNVSILAIFKYGNFLLDMNCNLLHWFGVQHSIPKHLEILLPLGISYYTFEAIGYLVDTYKGKPAAKSWLQYNFYIMYFPHLISGPIIRFNELEPQYRQSIQIPNEARIAKGFELIILGYFFKTAIANGSASIVDPIFAAHGAASSLQTYEAAFAFLVQLYFDFMGYTHIARGVSLLFNIELPINFSHPFNTTTITNFWQRWQMSLTRWIRDYIFIPLGGHRVSYPRMLFNVFITMFICGIWHGAGYHFVLFGAFQGILFVGYYLYKALRKRMFGNRPAWLTSIPYITCSFLVLLCCTIVSALLFRAQKIAYVSAMIAKLLDFPQLATNIGQCFMRGDLMPLVMITVSILCLVSGPFLEKLYERLMIRLPYPVKVQFATYAIGLSWLMTNTGVQPFMYFDF